MLDLDALQAALDKATRPGDVWQYGIAGAAGIVAYDMDDVRCI